jgi:7,8-dihydropterin-6-yl-methyl-4-(beta-D-ribofuranosyl)aminobenzene 5'-phosphate synthase
LYVLSEDCSGYDTLFWAQFGISFLVDVRLGGSRRRILFDAATDAGPVLHNMKLLGIEPRDVDLIVLSHHHVDHTGGLAGVLQAMEKRPVAIVAHPEIFKTSVMAMPYADAEHFPHLTLGLSGENRREEIERLGGEWVLAREPMCLMAGVVTTGEIGEAEKVPFEAGPYSGLRHLEEGSLRPEYMRDEIGLVVNTRQGLVLIAGCSHPGVVSMAKKAAQVGGSDRMHAVIGGFHLIDAGDDRIDATVRGLLDLGVSHVFTGHCTGAHAERKIEQAFAKGFLRIYSGKIIDIA